MRFALALPIVGIGVIAGCAVPQHVRDDTKTIGLYVQTVMKDAEDFARMRDVVVKARTANIAALELKTLRAEQAIQRDLQPLEIIQDRDRLELLKALQDAPNLIIAQRREYETKALSARNEVAIAKSALNVQLSKLSEASAALLQLAEPRSLRDDMRFYVDFFKQVRAHVEKDLKEDPQTQPSTAVSGGGTK
jgi:hypothetical protein